MLGDVLGRAALDDLPGVHDQHLVGEIARRRDVVGDVEHGELEALAQVVEQGRASPAGSRRPASRPARRRAARSARRRARGRTRPAAAGRRTARAGTCRGTARPGSAAPAPSARSTSSPTSVFDLRPAVQPHRALEVVAHRMHGVQRRERVLEDQLDLALVAPESAAAGQVDRLAVERGSCPRSAAPARPAAWRPWTCPSRSRRPARRPRSGRGRTRRRATACSTWPRPSRKSLAQRDRPPWPAARARRPPTRRRRCGC